MMQPGLERRVYSLLESPWFQSTLKDWAIRSLTSLGNDGIGKKRRPRRCELSLTNNGLNLRLGFPLRFFWFHLGSPLIASRFWGLSPRFLDPYASYVPHFHRRAQRCGLAASSTALGPVKPTTTLSITLVKEGKVDLRTQNDSMRFSPGN